MEGSRPSRMSDHWSFDARSGSRKFPYFGPQQTPRPRTPFDECESPGQFSHDRGSVHGTNRLRIGQQQKCERRSSTRSLLENGTHERQPLHDVQSTRIVSSLPQGRIDKCTGTLQFSKTKRNQGLSDHPIVATLVLSQGHGAGSQVCVRSQSYFGDISNFVSTMVRVHDIPICHYRRCLYHGRSHRIVHSSDRLESEH